MPTDVWGLEFPFTVQDMSCRDADRQIIYIQKHLLQVFSECLYSLCIIAKKPPHFTLNFQANVDFIEEGKEITALLIFCIFPEFFFFYAYFARIISLT